MALASLVAGVFVLVVFTASGPSLIVSRSVRVFTSWEAGPLHGLFGLIPPRFDTLMAGLSLLVGALAVAYFVALASARSLSARAIVLVVVALHLILLLSPPILSSDLFSYMGYARLGGVHGLNPYTHVIARELHDPVYTFTTWRHLHSPYGPLFTAATFPDRGRVARHNLLDAEDRDGCSEPGASCAGLAMRTPAGPGSTSGPGVRGAQSDLPGVCGRGLSQRLLHAAAGNGIDACCCSPDGIAGRAPR